MANPLREAMKARFYPFAESKGFVRAKSTHPHFTTFRRVQCGMVNVFDVQWDKYGRPRFVINFGEAVHETSMKGVETQDCKVLLRLQPSKYSPRWWQIVKPWREVLKTGRLRYKPAEVVDQAIAAFQEMEAWWQIVKPWREVLKTGRLRYRPAEVVDQAIAAFQEMESWWAEHTEGAHVHSVWRRAGH